MSKIIKAEYYESKNKNLYSYGRLYYESGRNTLFNIKDAPKTFNAFCLCCNPLLKGETKDFEIWEYVLNNN